MYSTIAVKKESLNNIIYSLSSIKLYSDPWHTTRQYFSYLKHRSLHLLNILSTTTTLHLALHCGYVSYDS
jgi:hypothetical protein